MNVIFEYPLQWPVQQPRTKRRDDARFGEHSVSKAGGYLVADIIRMGANNCVISSNLQTRKDGQGFLAKQNIEDPGVAIYFQLKGNSKVMACDKWNKPEHNLWALYLSVQAIRGLDRWGGSEFLDGLFTGFKALPSPNDVIMFEKNYFENVSNDALHMAYKILAFELHPDRSGDDREFVIMKKQYEQRKKEMGEF